MEVVSEVLPTVLEIQPRRFGDNRGWFTETYNQAKMNALGVDAVFVQDNQSFSLEKGTVRGLHLQLDPSAQGKLVRVLQGSIFDVAVDLRAGSATFGQNGGVTLTAEAGNMLWVPPGFAHGFATLEPETMVAYKVTSLYDPDSERSVLWNDPALGINWPVSAADARLSEKDALAPTLDDADWISA